jgi:hypothetical protein
VLPSLSFKLTTPVPLKSYSVTHESGLAFKYNFCETCGTALYKENAVAFEGKVILLAGTLDKEDGKDGEHGIEGVNVQAELWIKHRVAWLGALEGVAQCQEFPEH